MAGRSARALIFHACINADIIRASPIVVFASGRPAVARHISGRLGEVSPPRRSSQC